MLLLRNLIYWLFVVVFSIIFLPIVALSLLFPKGINHTTRFWALSLFWMLEHVVGLRYQVLGREHIPSIPSIIACKHQSGWETLALHKIFPSQVFVAKRELFKIPVFGWGLKWVGTIGIDRSHPVRASQQIIEQGAQRKAQGLWITFFPEGTRITPGFRGRYKNGMARTAQVLQMNIVPVALNSGEFWPKNSFLKYPGTISVVIGEPIDYDAADTPDALTKMCEDWIEGEQAKIQGVGPFKPMKLVVPTPSIRTQSL